MHDTIIIQGLLKVKPFSPKVAIRESRRKPTSHSGLYFVEQFVEVLGVREEIDRYVRGYEESQCILSLAYSLITGDDCLENVNQSRHDETLLQLLGEERAPQFWASVVESISNQSSSNVHSIP